MCNAQYANKQACQKVLYSAEKLRIVAQNFCDGVEDDGRATTDSTRTIYTPLNLDKNDYDNDNYNIVVTFGCFADNNEDYVCV